MLNVKSSNPLHLDATLKETTAGQQQEVVSAAVHVHWDAHSGRGTRVSTDYMAIELDDRQAEWLIATLTEMRQAR